METIIGLIQKELCEAFKKAGYNEKYAKKYSGTGSVG